MSKETYLKKVNRLIWLISGVIILMGFFIPAYLTFPSAFEIKPQVETVVIVPVEIEVDENRIENGIHVRTGFIEAEGLMTVVGNCTSCHSSKIILQNRMSAEGWNSTIKWMQETQNLWDLGKNQEVIVNYLVTNYPQKKKGRRENLTNVKWYELGD